MLDVMPDWLPPLLAVVASALFIGLLVRAALGDLLWFRIPNWLSVALILVWPLFALAGLGREPLWMHGAAGVGAFVLGAALFFLRVWGGGDAKLFAALCLWTGLAGLPPFLFVTALAGGVLALVLVIARRFGRRVLSGLWAGRLTRLAEERGIPYGIALATGGLSWWATQILPPVIRITEGLW